ncbi:hypothetical protein [Pseudonocardia sp. GCM10023141]|uniref:hypothetical protein n=1 Tax=Pseudonocardia sp. GCM10023141 TaxID=3252653 RepID=UPI00360FC4D8
MTNAPGPVPGDVPPQRVGPTAWARFGPLRREHVAVGVSLLLGGLLFTIVGVGGRIDEEPSGGLAILLGVFGMLFGYQLLCGRGPVRQAPDGGDQTDGDVRSATAGLPRRPDPHGRPL